MNYKTSNMYSFSSKLWVNTRRVSKKTGEVSIYLQVIINGEHTEFPLKLRWPVNKIDQDRGILLPRRKDDPDVGDYNLLVQTEQGKHTDILRTYRLMKAYIDISVFRNELLTYDNKESFIGFAQRLINYRYNTSEIVQKTYRNQLATIAVMKEYDAAWRFDRLNLKFLNGFKAYLAKQVDKNGQLKYKPGTIWARMKDIKAYLTLADSEPMIKLEKSLLSFSNPKPTWSTLYLNKEEIRRLMIVFRNGYLTDIEENVICAYLFTCFTSLRISDVYRVNPNWRLTQNNFYFLPKKNERKGKWLTIPIMPMAFSFIRNTTGKYFTLPSEAEYNRTLKDLAIKAEIKKKLTSHSGRHTFGYLFMTSVGNLKALQEILGHSKIETTMRYAHLDEEYKIDAVTQIQADFSDLILRKVQ